MHLICTNQFVNVKRKGLKDITNTVQDSLKSNSNFDKDAQCLDTNGSYVGYSQGCEKPSAGIDRNPTLNLPSNYVEEIIEVESLDAEDVLKPKEVPEYASDIFTYLRSREENYMISPDYFENQSQINTKMRSILIDWMLEVHYRFKLHTETLFMSINILDRFCMKHEVPRSKLQLIGVVSLLIAAKYEEISPPDLSDLVYITDHTYSKEEVIEYESKVLQALEFSLSAPSIYIFLNRFCKAARSSLRERQLSNFYSQRILQEFLIVRYPPSNVAASCLYLSRYCLYKDTILWTPAIEKYTQYSESEVLPCVRDISKALRNPTSLSSAKKKFRGSRMGKVSELSVPHIE